MSDDDKKEQIWAANIAFVGDKSKVKALIKQFQQAEESGGISDFTQINGPFDRLQDLLKDRVKNLSLTVGRESRIEIPEIQDAGNSELVIFKTDYESDIPIDDYDEDVDE